MSVIPSSHAPDEEWAEERVRRLMETGEALPVPSPGDEIDSTKTPADTAEPAGAPEAVAEAMPASDDGIDELLSNPEKVAAEEAVAEANPGEDKAVEEIMKTDGDEALKAQDAAAKPNVVMKPGLWERFKNDWSDWWDNPRKRYITLAVFAVLLAAVFSFGASRSYVLSLVGVRASVTVSVLDNTTNLPLKNAQVSLAGETGTSDEKGKVNLHHVKLGTQELIVSKQAFAATKSTVYVGMGNTVLPAVPLKAVGTQFTFNVTNYLSGKPVANVEVSSGKATALTDTKGKAVLTVQPSSSTQLKVAFAAKGYRTDTLNLETTSKKTTSFSVVDTSKAVFVSKQSGKYDLYASDLDGKNRKVLLAGTGQEAANITLSVGANGSEAALVSTRDNQHDSQGYLLSTLSLVDIANGKSQTLEHAEAITVLGWSGSRLIYQQTVAGASAANATRQRIISYDTATNKKVQLAAANYFNGTALIGNGVYYAVSSSDPGTTANFVKINADSTGKLTLANQEVWTLLRTSYDTLTMQGANGAWLSYTIGNVAPKPATAPASYNYVQFVDDASSVSSLWVDNRDGKGALLNHETKTGKDSVVTTQTGLGNPDYWLDDTTAVYRVQTPKETADYAVSTLGGTPKKIADVTPTTSFAQTR